MTDDRIQKFLRLKELQINKMSSVIPFIFNAVELCIVIINKKPWVRAREVCKTLEYDVKNIKNCKHHKGPLHSRKYCSKVSNEQFTPINWPIELQKYVFTLMTKGCIGYYFQVNGQRQKTSEGTASMYCFLMFDSSLVISHMR